MSAHDPFLDAFDAKCASILRSAQLISDQRDALGVKFRKLVEEIEWLCDGREDIDNNGGPNLAMQIMQAIRELKP
jgi:hypothetical protein